MLHLVQKNDWIKIGRLKAHITGLERLDKIAESFTPERVAEITGVSSEILLRITKEYVLQDRAVMYGRMGMSTQEHGGLCHWLTSVLNILTHHFDRAGGAMFPKPAVDVKRQKGWHLAHDRWHSRVRKLPEFDGELPVSVAYFCWKSCFIYSELEATRRSITEIRLHGVYRYFSK